MIIGIGIDIVHIDRMKKWLVRPLLVQRYFHPAEIIDSERRGVAMHLSLAARFAAKEAVIKAISKEHPMALTDMFILNKENGAPYCKFKKDIGVDILLSITHIEDYAVACAVAQKKA